MAVSISNSGLNNVAAPNGDTIRPFAQATVNDDAWGGMDTLTLTFTSTTETGTLTPTYGSPFVAIGNGTYIDTGSARQLQTDLNALITTSSLTDGYAVATATLTSPFSPSVSTSVYAIYPGTITLTDPTGGATFHTTNPFQPFLNVALSDSNQAETDYGHGDL
jgi:hypothetical protein